MDILATVSGKMLITVLMSMVPVIELRGAIPIGVSLGLGYWLSIALSILGNLIPVPFLILFTRHVFEWLRGISKHLDSFVTRLEQRAERKSELVQRYAFWGLVILVAIPLPGTGAWTGALVAVILKMRLRRAFPAIAIGVVIAAILVSFLTYGAGALFS